MAKNEKRSNVQMMNSAMNYGVPQEPRTTPPRSESPYVSHAWRGTSAASSVIGNGHNNFTGGWVGIMWTRSVLYPTTMITIKCQGVKIHFGGSCASLYELANNNLVLMAGAHGYFWCAGFVR